MKTGTNLFSGVPEETHTERVRALVHDALHRGAVRVGKPFGDYADESLRAILNGGGVL